MCCVPRMYISFIQHKIHFISSCPMVSHIPAIVSATTTTTSPSKSFRSQYYIHIVWYVHIPNFDILVTLHSTFFAQYAYNDDRILKITYIKVGVHAICASHHIKHTPSVRRSSLCTYFFFFACDTYYITHLPNQQRSIALKILYTHIKIPNM